LGRLGDRTKTPISAIFRQKMPVCETERVAAGGKNVFWKRGRGCTDQAGQPRGPGLPASLRDKGPAYRSAGRGGDGRRLTRLLTIPPRRSRGTTPEDSTHQRHGAASGIRGLLVMVIDRTKGSNLPKSRKSGKGIFTLPRGPTEFRREPGESYTWLTSANRPAIGGVE